MAGRYDFVIKQGETFVKTIYWKDAARNAVPVVGYIADLQIRETAESTTTLLSIASDGISPCITLGGALGTIDILIPAATTLALDFSTGVYDLRMTSGTGVVTYLLEGDVTLVKAVTHD